MVLVMGLAGRAIFFLVMKVFPDAVAMRGRKGWKNRGLVCGIATRLLLALFNFLIPAI